METLSSVLPQNPVLYARPTAATTKLSGVQSSKWPRLYGMGKGQTFHHMIPHVAHMRLTPVSPPVHTVRVRPSVILAEIDRIQHKMRPSLSYQPEEDFLNTRSIMSFDDETRSIRAHTAALLKRIHEPLPRARRIFPITVSTYQETPIPERITSDTYIRRLLGPTSNVKQDIICMSHYDEPAKRFMGKGHLACVSFAGGRAFPRRKNYYYDDERVKNDVKYLSLYKKNREAADAPVSNEAATLSGDWYHNLAAQVKPERAAPKSRFYRPTHIPDIAEAPAPTRVETQNNLKEALNKKKLEQRDEEARIAELARQEQLAKEATMERQKQLQKKAQEESERKAEEQRKEEERRAEEQRRQAELERQAAEKKAEEERKEAERKAEEERKEAERKAEEERKEAERKAEEERKEAERKAEEERQEAERKAEEERKEAERKAEEERQEAERKLEEERKEAERKAEEERKEAERKAEEERQEAERKAELERQEAEMKAEEEGKQVEEKASLEEEQKQSEQEVPIDQAPVEESKTEPEEQKAAEAEVVVEDKVVEEVHQDAEVTSPGPEPVVEEPVSPSDQQPQSSGVEIQEAVTTEDEDA